MKKALTYTLAVAMLLSLAACSKPQTGQPDTSQPDPATTSTQADASTPETTQDANSPRIGLVADKQEQEKQIVTQEELEAYFLKAYETGEMFVGTEDIKIESEITLIENLAEQDNKQLPSDYADQYKAWRPVVEEAPPAEVSKEVKGETGTTPQNGGASSSGQQAPNDSQQEPSQQTQQSKPKGSGKAIYGGFATYDEYIADLQTKIPGASIEELKSKFPDLRAPTQQELDEQDALVKSTEALGHFDVKSGGSAG